MEDYINKKRKAIEDYQLKDDIFFKVVFDDIDAAEELLQTLLDDDTIQLANAKTQFEITNIYGHSVILDLFGISNKGVKHNVEAQINFTDVPKNRRVEYLRKRAFYNASLIANKYFDKGKDYLEISDIYIIFITPEDEFKSGVTVEKIQESTYYGKEYLDSFIHYYFVNMEIKDNTRISELMAMFEDSTKNNDKFKRISTVTNKVKYSEGGRMKMHSMIEEIKNEGKLEGKLEGKFETIIELYKKGKLSSIEAAEYLEITEKEFLKKYDEYKL